MPDGGAAVGEGCGGGGAGGTGNGASGGGAGAGAEAAPGPSRLGMSIEEASMAVIEREIGEHPYAGAEWLVVRRIIHSTADFDFAGACAVRFSGGAVEAGLRALRGGRSIVADVNGVAGLIGRQGPARHGNAVVCRISDPAVAKRAEKEGTTRAQASMRESAGDMDGGVVVVGNAPTALLEVLAMADEGAAAPALVVGLPVGFISAAESKEALAARTDVAHITNAGRKGGSAAAAAAVNALFRML